MRWTRKANLWLFFFFYAVLCQYLNAAEFNLTDSLIYLDHFAANGIYLPPSAQDKSMQWTVTGERATLQGQQCELNGFELTVRNQNEEAYQLQSAHCEFSRSSFEFKSPSAVILQGKGIRLSGIGYDVYGQDEDLLLVIRNTVQINFQRQYFAEGKKAIAPIIHTEKKPPPTAGKQ